MNVFGTVPSRRLGRSLGINIIPHKTCSYDCVYCQLGRTCKLTSERKTFYKPEDVFNEVKKKIDLLNKSREKIDYLTFVSQGEPTLDINLAKTIDLLKGFNIKIAVITNSSLIQYKEVRELLNKADWVSLKIDTIREDWWKRINRPCDKLDLGKILEGIIAFAKTYDKILTTETMIVKNLNDKEEDIISLADFLKEVNPQKAYISIPIRPPAEKWVEKPDEEVIIMTYHLLREKVSSVEYLTGYEGNSFVSTGNIKEDLLAITSLHPMKEITVKKLLSMKDAGWYIIEELLRDKVLLKTPYKGENFYIKRYSE